MIAFDCEACGMKVQGVNRDAVINSVRHHVDHVCRTQAISA